MSVAVIIRAARASIHLSGDDAVAREDMRRARHAGIEAADGAQDIDPFEILGVAEGFEERRV